MEIHKATHNCRRKCIYFSTPTVCHRDKCLYMAGERDAIEVHGAKWDAAGLGNMYIRMAKPNSTNLCLGQYIRRRESPFSLLLIAYFIGENVPFRPSSAVLCSRSFTCTTRCLLPVSSIPHVQTNRQSEHFFARRDRASIPSRGEMFTDQP